MTTLKRLQEIFKAADSVKAEDPKILDLRKLTSYTDYFFIASGRSDRQVQAIADKIVEELTRQKVKPLGIEGYETGHWILIDYGDVVAHIFYGDTREFYAIEKLWSDAPQVNLSEKTHEVAS